MSWTSRCKSSSRHLSTGRPSDHRPTAGATNTVTWKALRAPALFGTGLYLGLMIFGEHRETKQESEYFEGLRGMFWGDGNDGGNGHDADDDRGKG